MDDDDAAEGRSNPANGKPSDLSRSNEDGPPRKKARGGPNENGQQQHQAKQKGQNKGRKFARKEEEVKLCNSTARGLECTRLGDGGDSMPQCKNSHDLKPYLEQNKEQEIQQNLPEEMATTAKPLMCPVRFLPFPLCIP